MNAAEQLVYNRPRFDPSGRIIARAEVTIGGITWTRGQEMPSLIELGLSEWEGSRLWRTMQIDTLPHEPVPSDGKKSKKK